MTYSEFETRFNNYFNSISEQDACTLKTFLYGRVYPTMSTEEKKKLYNLLNSLYSEIHTAYALIKMNKNYDSDTFAKECREIPKEERLLNNFIYTIFFDDAIFEEQSEFSPALCVGRNTSHLLS